MLKRIGEVDLEIYSQPAWTQFRKNLSSEDKKILTIWRSGAVWTPTWRFYRPGSDQMDVRTPCKWCQTPQASSCHFFAERPSFDDQRMSLEAKFGIHNSWWGRQPRCCSKTGWVTFSAAPDFDGSAVCYCSKHTWYFHCPCTRWTATCCQCRLISFQCATLTCPFFRIPNFAVLFCNLPSFTAPYRSYGPPSLCLNPSHLRCQVGIDVQQNKVMLRSLVWLQSKRNLDAIKPGTVFDTFNRIGYPAGPLHEDLEDALC